MSCCREDRIKAKELGIADYSAFDTSEKKPRRKAIVVHEARERFRIGEALPPELGIVISTFGRPWSEASRLNAWRRNVLCIRDYHLQEDLFMMLMPMKPDA